MKQIYLILIALFAFSTTFSQSITVSGQCISGTITASYVFDEAGKPAYAGSGTVAGLPNTALSIFWIGAPDNIWVIAFDGQPFFQNACNTPIPPGTSPNICAWTVVPSTSCTGGAALAVAGAVVLPVTLTEFTAVAAGTKVGLQWRTSQETNNRGFTLQRSADGLAWNDVGFVQGAGNASTPTQYRYTDVSPYPGINFYRLRQEDIDGRISFSDIATATINSNQFFSISNNPGNGIYKLTMPASNDLLQILVTDATGKLVVSSRTKVGNQVLDISREAPGVYWLLVKKGNVQTGVKLIKL